MAATKVLLDSGPLVGFLSQTDQHHRWALEVWNSLYDPLWTCEAVLSEAIFLLQSVEGSIGPLLELFERGLVKIDFTVSSQRPDL
jgi:predicted nucleic acid-binding protein